MPPKHQGCKSDDSSKSPTSRGRSRSRSRSPNPFAPPPKAKNPPPEVEPKPKNPEPMPKANQEAPPPNPFAPPPKANQEAPAKNGADAMSVRVFGVAKAVPAGVEVIVNAAAKAKAGAHLLAAKANSEGGGHSLGRWTKSDWMLHFARWDALQWGSYASRSHWGRGYSAHAWRSHFLQWSPEQWGDWAYGYYRRR